ncbi:amino acid ABC transporter substrate-binding protein [Orenia marismortui]|uniref:amino acid ABC transporter substrate-binding protein n=1 Tax=Orenia marismortui TaxID=46469 RepID=UPI00035FFB8A|nr:amino acid ABC transporter substrate-binding protein [Orenia marismortui]
MKKNMIILIVLLMSVSLIISGCGGNKSATTTKNSLEEIKEQGYFVVGLDDNFPPMGFRSESGEIVGFDIDLAKEAAKRLGVDVKFKPVDWDGVILSLKNGNIDVIWNGLTVTEKRKEQIAFSNVYVANRQAIIVRKDSDIKTTEDLAESVVGLQMGSSSEQALKSNQELSKSLKNIRKYSNNVEALLDLRAGRIDAVIIDEIVGRYYITKKKADYKVLDQYLAEEDYAVGIRKEDNEFREELNKVLDEMKEDGTAAKISEKWFSEDILVK